MLDAISMMTGYFNDNPLDLKEPKDKFGVMGERVELLIKMLGLVEFVKKDQDRNEAHAHVEKFGLQMFPWLENPSRSEGENKFPLRNLQKSWKKGTKGLVIPCGKGNARLAMHLVSALRSVLKSELPIEIFYAGEEDLPVEYREIFTSFSDIYLVDISTIFTDDIINLREGGWAIKPFAALASSFERVMVLDADCVFVQPPEVIFDSYSAFRETGALFFHDRLLWKGAFKFRHVWYHEQLKNREPQPALLKSLVWTEGWAEEADSAVVVLDKSRPQVLGGLLHAAWQNSYPIRDTTYKMFYGDKESWWFGFALVGAPFSFEEHYGGIAGREVEVLVDRNFNKTGDKTAEDLANAPKETRVCSFNIAHPDENGELHWWNGGLLKNKITSSTEYDVPTHFVFDGEWYKGATKPDASCVAKGQKKALDDRTREILQKSVDLARQVDQTYESLWHLKKTQTA